MIRKIFLVIFMCIYTVIARPNVSVIEQNGKQMFTLPSQLVKITKHLYKNLNFSPLFIIANLLDPQKMRSQLLTPYLGNGQIVTVKTEDGEEINCTFFNRNSKKLLIIGTGFGNEREKVAPLVHMFDKYNVVIFDYRGHGYEQPKLLDTTQWPVQPDQQLRETIERITPFIDWTRIPNINLSKTTLGVSEEKDLLAVIRHFKSKQPYEKTFGIGFCFSSFVFAKAAALNPGLFDKMILDSSLYSPQNIINRITESPQLLFDPQKGSWDSFIKTTIKQSLLTQLASDFLKTVFSRLAITTQTTGHYLSQLKNTPILFFHGKDDKMTPYNEDFVKNFTLAKTNKKIAVIFENSRHLINHIKHKEIYKGISTFFFELPHDVFLTSLKDPQIFVDREFDLVQKEVRSFL